MKKAALFSFICVALLFGAGCTTNNPGGPSPQAISGEGREQSFIKEDEGLFPEDRGAIEITGSGENGRVLHKDVIYQRAQPGDYITVFDGKKLGAPRELTQGDIDYSKSQYKDITEELRDTSPGSVRDLLDTLIDDWGLDTADGMGPATGIEPVDLSHIRGKGVKEFISDVRDGMQLILIVMDPENSVYFDEYYQTPPWKKETTSEGGDHVFMLAKRVNSTANEIFCLNEDIQITKTLIRKIIDAAPPKLPPVPVGMVRINGGTFMMGSPASEASRSDDEGPQHPVTVSGFYMGKYEVTQQEYQEVMGRNPSSRKGPNLPVEKVSWFDAIKYCNRRSQREGLTPAYTVKGKKVTWNRNATGYRLPTEAEWEYACRAGTTGPFSTGDDITTNQANYDGHYPYNGNAEGTVWLYNAVWFNAKGVYRVTMAVGSFAPNQWGLYDMHGNVSEWCWDWYGSYSNGSQTDPAGASSGANRVDRGGSWLLMATHARSAERYRGNNPSYRGRELGFRVVRP